MVSAHRERQRVTAETVAALQTVYDARKIVIALRDAQSDRPWTGLECTLLSHLCEVLGVTVP